MNSINAKCSLSIYSGKTTIHDFALISDSTNYAEAAKSDIAKGKVILRRNELVLDYVPVSILDKYGFRFENIGCTDMDTWGAYNNVVFEYLNQRNGEGWWQKYLNDRAEYQRSLSK
jgi:hypothetical protein